MTNQRNIVSEMARAIKLELNGLAFIGKQRSELTSLAQQVSQGEAKRLGSRQKRDLERELLAVGVRCYPSLGSAAHDDYVTFFHVDRLYAHVLDLWTKSSPENSQERAAVLLKIKNKWRWDSESSAPAA